MPFKVSILLFAKGFICQYNMEHNMINYLIKNVSI